MAKHESPEVRRAQILEAARLCFGEAGYHKTKMDDIVARAGLSKGALYWHFKSKEEIFLALFDQFEQAIFASWEALPPLPADQALQREGEIVLATMLHDRSLVETWTEFIKHPLARERFARLYVGSRARLRETIEAGVERGELRTCDASAIAGGVTALIEGLLLQALVDPDFDPMPAWNESARSLTRGLSPEAP